MRINVAIPEANVKKPVLDAALEAVTRLNEDMIASGASPTSRQLIAKGARWQPEKPGDEHFDHGALINARGHGDCDDWAPLHAATLRVTGEDPGAKAIVRKSGPKRWHAIVQRSNGAIDDPSLAAGMPGPGTHGVLGACLPLMAAPPASNVSGSFIATPHLALRPMAQRHGQIESWQARTDLPWHWRPTGSPGDLAMVTLHQSPVSSQAVVGALRGAWRLGIASETAHPEQLRRLAALADACEGMPYEEVVERYGPEHANAAAQVVGSFFGKAFRGLKKLGKGVLKTAVGPLGKAALSFIPGGNLASMALSAASPLLKKSVARAQHLPPEQRAAALAAPPVRHSSPPSMTTAPIVLRPQEPNVTLLTNFADRLQRAYEFSGSRPAAPAAHAAPRRVVRRPTARSPATSSRAVPRGAWPR
jgi:hypothetical protein